MARGSVQRHFPAARKQPDTIGSRDEGDDLGHVSLDQGNSCYLGHCLDGGMLDLPRLFVYHCAAEKGSVQSETFKVMERRLMRAIMTPAMISSWVFGLILVSMQAEIHLWLYAKIALVLAMSGIHGAMAGWRKAFEEDRNTKSALFFRVWNEAPTLLMIAIVILVIVQPF